MKDSRWATRHSLFIVLVALFILIGALDMLNVDSMVYKSLCTAAASLTKSPCADYYDVPIWQVYLSVAVIAALYHVHAELQISNKHLSSRK